MKTERITPGLSAKFLVERKKSSHKGDHGRVLIVAGSRGMAGAAILAARAALRAGAGLVTLACPGAELPPVVRALPEAMTLPLPSKSGAVSPAAAGTLLAFQKERGYDLCLIGPGLSMKGGAPEFVRVFLRKLEMPAIVDADALNALAAGGPALLKRGPVRIFTPHEGEAARLLRLRTVVGLTREAVLQKLHAVLGGVCLLKGPGTLVTDGIRLLRNTSGGPELAKGGSGDVLAGLIAGLWAQAGKRRGFTAASALESAVLGVYLHGLCGELAAAKLTPRCVLAGELTEFMPAAFRKIK